MSYRPSVIRNLNATICYARNGYYSDKAQKPFNPSHKELDLLVSDFLAKGNEAQVFTVEDVAERGILQLRQNGKNAIKRG